MINKGRIQPLAGGQRKQLAKARAGGTTSSYLASHPGVAKHVGKVAAQQTVLESTKRPALGGMSGGNPNPTVGYKPLPKPSGEKKPYKPQRPAGSGTRY